MPAEEGMPASPAKRQRAALAGATEAIPGGEPTHQPKRSRHNASATGAGSAEAPTGWVPSVSHGLAWVMSQEYRGTPQETHEAYSNNRAHSGPVGTPQGVRDQEPSGLWVRDQRHYTPCPTQSRESSQGLPMS